MLYRTRLITELHERREEFVSFGRTLRGEVREASSRLRALAAEGSVAVRERVEAAGARVSYPSAEMDAAGEVAVRFGPRWRAHEEARAWAADALRGRTTFAADGSQIYPGREVSLPVAAAQIASFENPHTADGVYTKEAHFKIITPGELQESGRVYDSPEQVVNSRRFELEAAALRDFVERRRGWQGRGERAPVAFLDGTLLFSPFRKGSEDTFSKRQAAAAAGLVAASREARVPVVGYVDHSYAPDLCRALEVFYPDAAQTGAYDAQILRAPAREGAAPLLAAWGDRTVFWPCRRPALSADFYDEGGNPLVGFVYLQTTAGGNPARVEVPVWVYEAGLLEDVLDAVRAECAVGNGYPYALETADAAARMTTRDREQFLRVMQDFADEHRLDFRISRKPWSKSRRR